MNSASDWYYKYGHTRSSSLHIRLLNAGHMQITAMEKIMVFRAKNPHYHVIVKYKITMEHFLLNPNLGYRKSITAIYKLFINLHTVLHW